MYSHLVLSPTLDTGQNAATFFLHRWSEILINELLKRGCRQQVIPFYLILVFKCCFYNVLPNNTLQALSPRLSRLIVMSMCRIKSAKMTTTKKKKKLCEYYAVATALTIVKKWKAQVLFKSFDSAHPCLHSFKIQQSNNWVNGTHSAFKPI